MLFLTLRSFRDVKIDLKRRRNQVLLGGGWILLVLLRLLRSPLYSLLYRSPATDFNTGAKLLLRAGDVLLLILFTALLTATVCTLRKKST